MFVRSGGRCGEDSKHSELLACATRARARAKGKSSVAPKKRKVFTFLRPSLVLFILFTLHCGTLVRALEGLLFYLAPGSLGPFSVCVNGDNR